jgi:hypothetical protein
MGIAMTDRQRAAMYRARRNESALVAHKDLKGATTAVLLAGLARQLKAIGAANHADVARNIAAQLIRELCQRHEIRLKRGHDID